MEDIQLLLVDDETAFVETMTKRLAKRGLNAESAFSGEEALDKLDNPPRTDVVVLDVKMPGMDGIETLREIRLRHPLVEVIMLTGHATVETAISGMKLGAFDYLMKPCELDELVAKVREAANKKLGHEQKILEARARHIALRRGD
ncbi:MAG: response regulator [Proteobacteria bacterium]|nr:response regulator [Pseudomonadota bacterium]